MWPDLRGAEPSINIGAGMGGMHLIARISQACLGAATQRQWRDVFYNTSQSPEMTSLGDNLV